MTGTPQRLVVEEVGKSFRLGSREVEVLKDVSFELPAGGVLAITGPSGSGKSTLLHLLGALAAPDRGSIRLGEVDLSSLESLELARFRNRRVGFVFQHHHLLPQYDVLENVLLPTLAFPDTPRETDWAKELIDRVGLTARIDHRPGELSGGERQRAALARALVLRPDLVLCDEPTGSLDPETADRVADLLLDLQASRGSTLVAVTHNLSLAERFPEHRALVEGRLSPASGPE